ncbi:hypothetical protein PR048_030879 [Dryococelus australis]|uniref:Uncharacterized protein n=1 Tax=Dryococelus australis TaxID=614101 RepID=A0ABQ9GA43_9NEOP|nr:hypothetical protein PR048_030879 [Dryococelus australis]
MQISCTLVVYCHSGRQRLGQSSPGGVKNRWNARAGETGNSRENPPTSGIVYTPPPLFFHQGIRTYEHYWLSNISSPGIFKECGRCDATTNCIHPGYIQVTRYYVGAITAGAELLYSTVMCILERQMFVHWLLLQRVASDTLHLTVWHSLLVTFPVRIGSESSRACLINCDPIANTTSVYTCLTREMFLSLSIALIRPLMDRLLQQESPVIVVRATSEPISMLRGIKDTWKPVSMLASHQGYSGSISDRVPEFSHVGMPLVGGFSRGSPVFPALSFRRRSILTSITLIGSQDLAVENHPNLFTHSLTKLNDQILCYLAWDTLRAPANEQLGAGRVNKMIVESTSLPKLIREISGSLIIRKGNDLRARLHGPIYFRASTLCSLPAVRVLPETRHSGGPGFDSRFGHPDFGFRWFPEITPGECWDGSLTKAMADSFSFLPQSLSPVQLAPSLMTSLSTKHVGYDEAIVARSDEANFDASEKCRRVESTRVPRNVGRLGTGSLHSVGSFYSVVTASSTSSQYFLASCTRIPFSLLLRREALPPPQQRQLALATTVDVIRLSAMLVADDREEQRTKKLWRSDFRMAGQVQRPAQLNFSRIKTPIGVRRGEYGAAPEWGGGWGGGTTPGGPADRRHPERFPHAMVLGGGGGVLEPGSLIWEANSLTTTPPRPQIMRPKTRLQTQKYEDASGVADIPSGSERDTSSNDSDADPAFSTVKEKSHIISSSSDDSDCESDDASSATAFQHLPLHKHVVYSQRRKLLFL